MAGPPTPLAWKTTPSKPASASTSRIAIDAVVVLPSMVMATAVECSGASRAVCPCFTIPAIAAAALSKTEQAMAFKPRMSTTVCITIMSDVPTSGSNRCRPDAIGDNTIFGTPSGNSISAAADITAPSAPPRPMPPRTRPCRCRSATFARTNVRIWSTARPRVPACCNASKVVPPNSAKSACETSGSMDNGSPKIPVSITRVGTPRAWSRDRR